MSPTEPESGPHEDLSPRLCPPSAFRPEFLRGTVRIAAVTGWLFLAGLAGAAPAAAQAPAGFASHPPIVLTVEGTNVFIQRFTSNRWEAAFPNQVLGVKDRGRTGLRSRTSVRLSDLSVLRVGELSEFEIRPLQEEKVEAEFSLFRGLLYLLNRDRPGRHRFVTPTATAATRGTEFNIEVDSVTGRTVLTVLEGEAELSNAAGSVRIGSGQQGVAVLGQQPIRTAAIDTTNVVQWCLYYPAVLDVGELKLSPAEQRDLADSLEAYNSGDLLKAVSAYPAARVPASDAERVYAAALVLAVGQVSQAEAMLDGIRPAAPAAVRDSAEALRLVIGVVKGRAVREAERETRAPAFLATSLLSESYRLQSEFRIPQALVAARQATEVSPGFAFAWVRVAELEFSMGNRSRATKALETGLRLAPRNAQAVALKGFLLAAQNRAREAEKYFEQALALDSGLGNAWLGLGLCRIRQGRAAEGRLDLQVAAMTEPRRSLLRSYLGKAFSNEGDARHAEKELRIARELDDGDPTPWLYSALLLQQGNRINEGIDALEKSQDLNENRQVYRSRLLLDQDEAVRGANLASLYREAGMTEVSAQEAGRAVAADYANYSAHLFLANSFNELRDPTRVNLRHETPWFTEYLLANLLAPAGAGVLSQSVSQQEYSKLFEADRLGIASATEYFSHGEWRQNSAQFGVYERSSYDVEVNYRSDNGWRPNNDIEQFAAVVNLKHELTDKDSVYLQASYFEAEAGDVNLYYDPSRASARLRSRERQEPLLFAGYHREWRPGHHTLLLVSRLDDTYESHNPAEGTLFFNRGFGGPIGAVAPLYYDQRYRNELEIYSGEAQHLWMWADHTTVVGARFQKGSLDTSNTETSGNLYNDDPVSYDISQQVDSDYSRRTFYAYDSWQVWPAVTLVGGVSYDRVEHPKNFRNGPVGETEGDRDQFSPKGGIVWTPTSRTTVRGAYFEGLSGASLEQSVRLEPSQVAGFIQSYRSVIPDAVSGVNVAAPYDGWVASFEHRAGRGTFLTVAGEVLSSGVAREIGTVEFSIPAGPGSPFSNGQTREELDYRERSLSVLLNQLVGREWSFSAGYRVSKAELEDRYPQIPATAGLAGGFQREQDLEAVLHQVHLGARYNHPSGFFAGASAIWNRQSNQGYAEDIPGDDFWQFNVEGGWRFLRRRLEIRTGLLNITDQDYRLNPLNLTSQLPREREVFVALRFNF